MTRRFVLNETAYFGAGSREAIAEEVARKGLNKALIVTDSSLVKFGVVAKVSEVLDKAGVPFAIFDEVKPNPTVANVKSGLKAYAESGADFIYTLVRMLHMHGSLVPLYPFRMHSMLMDGKFYLLVRCALLLEYEALSIEL